MGPSSSQNSTTREASPVIAAVRKILRCGSLASANTAAFSVAAIVLTTSAGTSQRITSAVAAAELATEALDQTGGFAGQVVVAQVRLMAVDLLRATGLDRDETQRLLPSLPSGPVSYG